jgi:RES domain-containing protein
MPRTLNAIACHFHRILDLTAGSVRQRLGVSGDRMLQEAWWERQERDEEALTQAIGRIAWELGPERLLVPSAARDGGLNVVFFPDHKDPASVLQVIHPEELPDHVP